MSLKRRPHGLSLVELIVLLVVFAILLFVFIPKGARKPVSELVDDDLRNMEVAIERYHLTHDVYPAVEPLKWFTRHDEKLADVGGEGLTTTAPGRGQDFHGLTTPVAYTTDLWLDRYTPAWGMLPYAYHATPRNEDGEQGWIAWSAGPNREYELTDPAAVYSWPFEGPSQALLDVTYDPTNGTRSAGDIVRYKTEETEQQPWAGAGHPR